MKQIINKGWTLIYIDWTTPLRNIEAMTKDNGAKKSSFPTKETLQNKINHKLTRVQIKADKIKEVMTKINNIN